MRAWQAISIQESRRKYSAFQLFGLGNKSICIRKPWIYPQRIHWLRQDGVVGGSQAELPVLVSAKGEELARIGHCQSVGVAAGHFYNIAASQGLDGLRNENIIAVPMPKTAKISPGACDTNLDVIPVFVPYSKIQASNTACLA